MVRPFEEELGFEPRSSWQAFWKRFVDHFSFAQDKQQLPPHPWEDVSFGSALTAIKADENHHVVPVFDSTFAQVWQQIPSDMHEAFAQEWHQIPSDLQAAIILMERAKITGEDVAQQIADLANGALMLCTQDIRQRFAIMYEQFLFFQSHRNDCPPADSSSSEENEHSTI